MLNRDISWTVCMVFFQSINSNYYYFWLLLLSPISLLLVCLSQFSCKYILLHIIILSLLSLCTKKIIIGEYISRIYYLIWLILRGTFLLVTLLFISIHKTLIAYCVTKGIIFKCHLLCNCIKIIVFNPPGLFCHHIN